MDGFPTDLLRVAAVCALLAGLGCRANGGAPESGVPADMPRNDALRAGVPAPPGPAPETSRPIDLTTALRLAAGTHLDVLEARARVRELEGRASTAEGALLPVLTLGGNLGHTHGRVQGSFGEVREVDFDTVNAVGTVSVSANIGESIYRDLAAHRAAQAASDFEQATVQRTLFSVAISYVALVEAELTVRIQDQFVQEAQSLARLTQAKEAQGLGTSLDAERARAQAAAAEQRLIAARNDRQRRSKALAAALRLDATVDLVPVDTDLKPATLADPADPLPRWMNRAIGGRPERRALEGVQEAARQEASATRWSVWGPQLSAFALAGEVGTNTGDLDDRNSWGVFLGWSFSFGGPGRIETADARVEQAGLALERFQNELQAGVAAAHRELQLSKDRLEPAERELASAEKALRIAKATFEGGLLPESDLLLAQQAADRARLNRLAAVSRFNQAQLRLLAESGTASIGTLTGEERLLDPK
jgi:outer membrane protein TolC